MPPPPQPLHPSASACPASIALSGASSRDLYEYVDESELFDAPGDWWHYTIFYDCYGIKLCLQKEELDDGYVYYDGFEEHYDV